MSSISSNAVTATPPLDGVEINTKAVHKGDISVLEDVVALLAQEVAIISPISLVVKMRAAEVALDKWRRKLTVMANSEFENLKKAYPESNAFEVGGLATLSSYVPAGTWTWPDAVKKAEAELEAAKIKAMADKSATYTPGKVKDDSFLFKMSIK
jgi:hypothetical protein